MPDNSCVPICCKTGYRVDANGRKVTYHCLSIKDPSKLKVYIGFQKYNFLAIFDLSSCHFRRHIDYRFAHEIEAICAT